MITAMITAIFN